jgi:hypothetical protein
MTDLQASEKLTHFGKNKLTEKKPLPCFVRYLLVHTGLFNFLLWIGSGLCFLVYGITEDKTDKSNLILAIVLIVVILITGAFSF